MYKKKKIIFDLKHCSRISLEGLRNTVKKRLSAVFSRLVFKHKEPPKYETA
jgi:hypothetical protein